MIRLLIILYITCFGLYIIFTRQPDYFDGEITSAVIHYKKDSSHLKMLQFAFYQANKDIDSVNVDYPFRNLFENMRTKVIFDTANPQKAALYSLWGYWFKWGEIIFSLILLVALYQIAVALTNNPSPESIIEQLEARSVYRKKYDDH